MKFKNCFNDVKESSFVHMIHTVFVEPFLSNRLSKGSLSKQKGQASVAQLDARPTEDQDVADSTPASQQHSFVETDHEIFSTVILSLLLIQEGQLSVSGKRMCTILVNRSED